MLKVLVIDDEKPILSMFRLFLTAYGYHVDIAEDGKTALLLFEQEHHQIVFTDLKMPGIDGIEVLRRIRNYQNLETQVIIITGHGDMDKAIEALDLDASDFINKPVEKRALESALQRAEMRIKQNIKTMGNIIEKRRAGSTLYLEIYGKLIANPSFSSLDTLDSQSLRLSSNSIKELNIKFSDDFSINRGGIDWLVEFISSIRDSGVSITMSGLSYNYIRFFQMVGIHKIAHIVEAKDE
ncbi:MAG: response regulator [Desulfamplus sp.]|nr:response regulator [Desulfamplus sp.]